MPDFIPTGYLHVCDAVARVAEILGLPVPETEHRPPWRWRKSWEPQVGWLPDDGWRKAGDMLRQELYSGRLQAFGLLHTGVLTPVLSEWWGTEAASAVLNGYEGGSLYPVVFLFVGDQAPASEDGTGHSDGAGGEPIASEPDMTRLSSKPGRTGTVRVKRKVSDDAIDAWLKQRLEELGPNGRSNVDEDWAKAQLDLRGIIPREKFRERRRELFPPEKLKRGQPRGTKNRRDKSPEK